MGRSEDKPSDDAIADANAALVAGGAGTLASLAAGPAGALTAPALLLARRVSQRVLHRRELSAQRVVERAAEIVGGLNVLEERTSHDDERLELLARVLEAAGTTTLDSKIRALSRVLADGLRDEAGAVDEAMVLAVALHDLDSAHVSLLDLFDRYPVPPESVRGKDAPDSPGWEAQEIVAAFPTISVVESLLAVLNSHGLVAAGGGVTYPGRVGPAIWRISAVGQRCLTLLRERPVA